MLTRATMQVAAMARLFPVPADQCAAPAVVGVLAAPSRHANKRVTAKYEKFYKDILKISKKQFLRRHSDGVKDVYKGVGL